MCKYFMAILLVLASGSAAAAWVKVGTDESNTAYADSATKRKAGGTVKMWSLFDYRTRMALDNGRPYESMRAQFEYDCREERMRGVAVSFHSERMARGEIVHSAFEPGQWGPVPPGTTNAALWKMACGRR